MSDSRAVVEYHPNLPSRSLLVPPVLSVPPSNSGGGTGQTKIFSRSFANDPYLRFELERAKAFDERVGGTPPPAGEDARRLSPVCHSSCSQPAHELRRVPSLAENRERGDLKGARFTPGFTLLEIAVVLFLMGLMMLIAMPYIGGMTDAQLKSVSRRLAGRATYLYDEASSRKLVIRLVFDMDNNAYFVMTADPYSPQPAFLPDMSPSGARVKLPDAVRIRDVTVEGIGTLGRGTIATQFYPEGYVDGTIVHLLDAKGRVMTIGLDPLTGQVMIARGDLRKARAGTQ